MRLVPSQGDPHAVLPLTRPAGLVLAPMLHAPPRVRGHQFLPSMAIGALLWAPLLTTLLVSRAADIEQLQRGAAAWPGMAAGVVWNCGNLASVLAVQDPRVGLAVAYPVFQVSVWCGGACFLGVQAALFG